MADGDAGKIGRDQRNGDAEFVVVAGEMVGIVSLERQPQECRDRTKRDVTLVLVEAKAEHLLALELALADHAAVDHRSRVRAGLRAGEAETGNVAAIRQPR